MVSPDPVVFRPQPGPQTQFLASLADIAVYGGAAGGGKTWALLLEDLYNFRKPHFRSITFRRTSPQITNPGGLWEEAEKIYPYLGATSNQSSMTWRFPSGAESKFGHMQHEKNKLDWQGSQVPLIKFDELTHFSESQFFYMLSRNRSVDGLEGGFRPYMRATTNPDAGSWVASFISWWIGEDGFPIQSRSGVLRWMVREGGKLFWADTKEELVDAFGADAQPKSVTFIPAKLTDNKVLMEKDPGYYANLLALPLVERERLLNGNWKIMPTGGLVFNKMWFELADAVPAGGVLCRAWDFAGTEKKLKGDDPSFTAGVLMRKVDGRYYVEDVVAEQAGPAQVEKMFWDTLHADEVYAATTGAYLMTRWEIEPGSASRRENSRMIRAAAGHDAKGVPPRGDKIKRALPLAVQAEAGNVTVLRKPWTDAYLNHLHNQPENPHKDMMDASSQAFRELVYGSGVKATSRQGSVAAARVDHHVSGKARSIRG